MFDYVRSEIPMPDGFTGGLQTKEFDCELAICRINADGTLDIERFDQEVVPLAQRPHPDATDWRQIIGSMRRINERWERLDFHGVMSFYGMEGRPGEPGYVWHEYAAKFTDGRLVSIATAGDPK